MSQISIDISSTNRKHEFGCPLRVEIVHSEDTGVGVSGIDNCTGGVTGGESTEDWLGSEEDGFCPDVFEDNLREFTAIGGGITKGKG